MVIRRIDVSPDFDLDLRRVNFGKLSSVSSSTSTKNLKTDSRIFSHQLAHDFNCQRDHHMRQLEPDRGVNAGCNATAYTVLAGRVRLSQIPPCLLLVNSSAGPYFNCPYHVLK